MRDPFAALATTVRLWVGVALSVVPLRFTWNVTPGLYLPGTTLYGSCDTSGYCTPDIYVPGVVTPGNVTGVAGSPLRLFLVFAALALAYVATRRRTPRTRTVTRAALAALAIAAVLALGHGAAVVAVLPLLAIAVVAPLVVPLGRFGMPPRAR